MPTWELIITGCGTSHGNPMWGDPAWWSTDVRDRRRRSGAVLRGPDGKVVLIDTGPDLLHQLRDPYATWDGVSYPADCITRCDGVLFTHDHADHTHGINDLRHVNRLMCHASGRRSPLPVYGHPEHLGRIQAMFPYCFGVGEEFYSLASPALAAEALTDDQEVTIAGLAVLPFAMSHGPAGRTTGFRIGGRGGMAYLTDLKVLPPEADRQLQGLDLLVLDMLRDEPHPTHLCWAEAEQILARLQPRRCVLTHLGPEVRFAAWADRLPAQVAMAIDGWRTTFTAILKPEL